MSVNSDKDYSAHINLIVKNLSEIKNSVQVWNFGIIELFQFFHIWNPIELSPTGLLKWKEVQTDLSKTVGWRWKLLSNSLSQLDYSSAVLGKMVKFILLLQKSSHLHMYLKTWWQPLERIFGYEVNLVQVSCMMGLMNYQ